MGNFDTFVINEECPKCNHRMEMGFQSKSFGRHLQAYRIGDKVRLDFHFYVNFISDDTGFFEYVKDRNLEVVSGYGDFSGEFSPKDLDIIHCVSRNCATSHNGCMDEYDETFVYADVIIKDGIFVGIENLRTKEDVK